MCEGHFNVEVEVKPASSAASTGGPAAAPFARYNGVRVVVAVVGVRHYVASFGVMSRRFGLMSCWNTSAILVVMVVVAMSVYILFIAVRGTAGIVHRSRVGWCRGVVGIRRSNSLEGFRYVGWCRSIFYWYVGIFDRSVSA